MPPKIQKPVVGWREWVAMPGIGAPAVKAKIDTGAAHSALHAFDMEIVRRDGVAKVHFKIHPFQRDDSVTLESEAELLDQRWIRSSTGHETLRPTIRATIELLGVRFETDITLINRRSMGFRMLLGRSAIRRRFLVDPGRSFLGGRGPAARGGKRPE